MSLVAREIPREVAMATTPAQKPPRVPPIESIEQQFRRLEAEWYRDTAVLSDPGKIMGHPAMRAIIAMGEAVVPIILHDLQARTKESLIVWALPKIVGANPPFEGNNDKMIEAWLQWGRENGHL
jgi:hypothetical protein